MSGLFVALMFVLHLKTGQMTFEPIGLFNDYKTCKQFVADLHANTKFPYKNMKIYSDVICVPALGDNA